MRVVDIIEVVRNYTAEVNKNEPIEVVEYLQNKVVEKLADYYHVKQEYNIDLDNQELTLYELKKSLYKFATAGGDFDVYYKKSN